MTVSGTDAVEVTQADRHDMSHYEQMLDAQAHCVPCRLCGGKAIITDAGPGMGYYIACSNGSEFKSSEGCMLHERRLGGWAYNVMDWWNRLHQPAIQSISTSSEELVKGKAELLQLMDSIWRSEYRTSAPNWQPLDYLAGMISQIDNMYAGIREQRDKARWNAAELAKALERARAALHQHYTDWDGEPEDAVELQMARAACDAALASHRGEGG